MEKKNTQEGLAPDEKEEILEEVVSNETEEAEGEVIYSTSDDSHSNAEKQLEEAVDKYKRVVAEYYNYRERTTKEKAAMYGNGVMDTIEKLLPVVDNLERAIASQKGNGEEESIVKGVEMILKQFKETLLSLGVEEIPALGEKFDPNLHSAVSHIQDDNFGENEISLEMMKGYKFKDKVIRHSMVQVAN